MRAHSVASGARPVGAGPDVSQTRTQTRTRTQTLALTLALALTLLHARAQGYTSFLTGDTSDVAAVPTGGACLMGGATEDDNAMRWFLGRSGGGDILVLRASGADGYNDYLYSQLGVSVHSVETIRFDAASAAGSSYVRRRIAEAEAIWFAGGDQWDYVAYWRGTGIDSLVNAAVSQRGVVVGGTSAGMAILGSHYFSAQNGTVTSATALSNPYAPAVAVDSTPFLAVPYLQRTITDTHYDNPDRRGRHLVFLARILADGGVQARGIACEEYTAVCIDTAGVARVFGGFPGSDDRAYFLQVNCEVPANVPELCQAGSPLQWDQGGRAVKVFVAQGTPTGSQTFDLADWSTASGGYWEEWSAYNGSLIALGAAPVQCGPAAVAAGPQARIQLSPNPSGGRVTLRGIGGEPLGLRLHDSLGRLVWSGSWDPASPVLQPDWGHLPRGRYHLCAGGQHIAVVLQ